MKSIVDMPGARITTSPADLPRWMLSLMPERERGYIDSIEIRGADPTDKSYLEAIAKLPRIRDLNFVFCSLNDRDCELLSRVKSLERIQFLVNKGGITDVGVESLLKLPNLERLAVTGTKATWKSHVKLQELGLTSETLVSDYNGMVEITERNPDIDAINQLPSPPFRGVAIEAGKADIELLKKLKTIHEIRLYVSNDAVPEEMKVLEEILNWPHLTSIEVFPGKQGLPQSRRGCSDVLFSKVARLLEGRTIEADLSIGPEFKVEFALESTSANVTGRTFRLGLYSVMGDFVESVEPMRRIESLEFKGYSKSMAELLRVFPNVRVLRMNPEYPGLDVRSKHHFANLANLEELRIKAIGFYQTLPWDFFADWKSQNSLRKLHLESEKMWDQPSLKPLLEFENLESVFILTGRDEPVRSIDEIKVAVEVEMPPPEVSQRRRFRSVLSKVVADVEEHFTPPKPGQRANQRQ